MMHRKEREDAKLQITSLMDAMTILLLFLLKNLSTEGVILTNADDLVLPLSISDKAPQEMTVQIAITPKKILVDNIPIVDVAVARQDTIKSIQYTIKPLEKELKKHYEEELQMVKIGALKKVKGEIIIQADKNTEYDILYKVLLTCGSVGYNKIKLAVMKKDAD